MDAVIAGDCDIGLTYESDSVPTLHYEPIVWESQQLYCGRNHRLFGKTVGNPALLSRQRFVLAQGDEPKDVERFRLHYALGRHVGARADDLSEAMRLIQLGVGVGFLPTIVADTAGDKLWPLLPASLLPSYFVYMISLEVSLLSTPAQLFHEEMRQSMREHTTFR
ncbi:hypothetical protein GOB81_16125 [Acetobacter sp. LMG 1627]|uniref:LysR substrate-binding domain-containing protein n=1 Tax=Acetobacter conturbans TaxID=1737472 RepID=A0ABX0K325_9PROT|nr:hypothetical protein [Acetobacter conturbans]